MAGATTDKFTQATTNSRPVPTTVTSTRAPSGTTLQCLALTGWGTGTKVHLVTYKVNTSNAKIAGSQCDWYGIVSGTTLTSLTLMAGTDAGNAIGDIVEAAPTAAWANDLYTGLTQDHDVQGRHKDLHGTNGAVVHGLTDTSTAVNNLRSTNSVSGSAPTLTSEGTDTNIDLKVTAKGTGVTYTDGAAPQKLANKMANFVESGGVVVQTSGLTGSFSNIVFWVGGQRFAQTSIANKAYTASKDTYVDIATTGTVTYSAVNVGATSPALAANSVRVAIVTTNGSAITVVRQAGIDTVSTSGAVNAVYPNGPSGPVGFTAYTNGGSASGKGFFVNFGGLKVLTIQGATSTPGSWLTIDWTAVGFSIPPTVVGTNIGQGSGTAGGWVEFTSLSSPAGGSPETNGCSILTRISTTVNSVAPIDLIVIGV